MLYNTEDGNDTDGIVKQSAEQLREGSPDCTICSLVDEQVIGQMESHKTDVLTEAFGQFHWHTFAEGCHVRQQLGVQSIEEYRTYQWLFSKCDPARPLPAQRVTAGATNRNWNNR